MPTNTTTTITGAAAAAIGFAAGALVASADDAAPPPVPLANAAVAEPAPRSDARGHERCNGLDDDWNGVVDENWPMLGSPCDGADPDDAACGRFVCREDGTGAECREDAVPREERCSGADDDCDGLVDEGFGIGNACGASGSGCAFVCGPDPLGPPACACPGATP